MSETGAAMFLARFGLKRGTDVAIIQLGGLPEIVTAMERGGRRRRICLSSRIEPGQTARHERAF